MVSFQLALGLHRLEALMLALVMVVVAAHALAAVSVGHAKRPTSTASAITYSSLASCAAQRPGIACIGQRRLAARPSAGI